MPELARDKWKDALKHLLEDVLGLPEDSNIWKGLAHHAGESTSSISTWSRQWTMMTLED